TQLDMLYFEVVARNQEIIRCPQLVVGIYQRSCRNSGVSIIWRPCLQQSGSFVHTRSGTEEIREVLAIVIYRNVSNPPHKYRQAEVFVACLQVQPINESGKARPQPVLVERVYDAIVIQINIAYPSDPLPRLSNVCIDLFLC